MSGIQNNNWATLINSSQKYSRAANSQSEKKLKSHKAPKKVSFKHQEDPLNKYPLRGLAYTNEVGVAIMDVLPKLGAALWVPALMYFGADIYNKYAQGRNGDYSDPSKRTAFERATFQALASVILPTFAVLGGKEVTSKLIQRKNEFKISPKSQEEILKSINNEIGKGSFMDATKETKEKVCKKIGNPILELIELRRNQSKNKDTFSGIHFKETPKMDEENVKKFVRKNIEEVLDLKKFLRGEEGASKTFHEKYTKFYSEQKVKFTKDVANDAKTAERKAVRATMQKYLTNKIVKTKTVKTIGGFVALIALALPIDYLVEEVILKKAVEPSLDYVEKKIEENPEFLGSWGKKK